MDNAQKLVTLST